MTISRLQAALLGLFACLSSMPGLGVFDYRDYLFEEYLSIYLLVKDLSIYDDDTTIIYRGYLKEIHNQVHPS